MRHTILFLFICFLLVGCKPSTPPGILKKGKMEAVLYDYHFAENLPYKGVNAEVARELHIQSVFKKHNITKTQFDKSLAYYTRHSSELLEIYKNLDERYTEQFLALGGGETARPTLQSSASGDTLDVWNNRRTLLLFPKHPYQTFSFEIPVDTAFHAGDIVIFQFDTEFIYSTGQRSAVAVLNMVVKGDSVLVANTMPSSTSHYQLRLQDTRRKGIKHLRGYFMLNDPATQQTEQTMQVLVVKNIQLVRIHTKDATIEIPELLPPDSLPKPMTNTAEDVPPLPRQHETASETQVTHQPVASPKRTFGHPDKRAPFKQNKSTDFKSIMRKGKIQNERNRQIHRNDSVRKTNRELQKLKPLPGSPLPVK